MDLRSASGRVLVALGGVLVLLAAVLVVSARSRPAQSMEDLGLFVGALLLAAGAGILFAAGLLAARSMPRWMVVVAALGIVLAAVPAVGFLTTGVPLPIALGALVLVLGVLALARAPRLWTSPGPRRG